MVEKSIFFVKSSFGSSCILFSLKTRVVSLISPKSDLITLKIDKILSFKKKIDFSTMVFLFLLGVDCSLFTILIGMYAISVQQKRNSRFTFSLRSLSKCGTKVVPLFGGFRPVLTLLTPFLWILSLIFIKKQFQSLFCATELTKLYPIPSQC